MNDSRAYHLLRVPPGSGLKGKGIRRAICNRGAIEFQGLREITKSRCVRSASRSLMLRISVRIKTLTSTQAELKEVQNLRGYLSKKWKQTRYTALIDSLGLHLRVTLPHLDKCSVHEEQSKQGAAPSSKKSCVCLNS